eukprot:Pompholyxophrys_punicea_v1_NODE_162_length_3055_cov_4.636000.p1 type:complete len:375 gc:universal NODE_162_length_3055_cov_4.636000:2697-1573(-)
MEGRRGNGVPAVCNECEAKPFQYVCPRCSFRSCSLQCCVAHKVRTGCNGKRDRTSFLPLHRMSDKTITSDYHFLEDVLGNVQSGRRLLRQMGGGGGPSRSTSISDRETNRKRPRSDVGENGDRDGNGGEADELPHAMIQALKSSAMAAGDGGVGGVGIGNGRLRIPRQPESQSLHPKWRHFQRFAAERGIQVLFMPSGMERRKNNRSIVQKNLLHWTVEWRIHRYDSISTTIESTTEESPASSDGTCLVLRSTVCESTDVRVALETVFASFASSSSSSVGDRTLRRSDLDFSGMAVLTKKLPCASSSPRFVRLSPSATLGAALRDMTIVEYPTLEVVPLDKLEDYPLVVRELTPEVGDADRERLDTEAISASTK